VEVQILGDGEGDVVHLYERECSLQRRHQKVIEEAPSPSLDEETRAALTGAAVAIGHEVRYRSAGTCEFLLDPDGKFWFLEVNARIQVEHPVTELLTGCDLVAAQLRIAEGKGIGLTQGDVQRHGAAVEARVYAEDADAGFLPQAGPVLRADFPAAPWIRVDAGVAAGDEVSSHYDPMVAKVIAWGPDRTSAWKRLGVALGSTVVHGPVTNLPFLRELAAHPKSLAGDFDTGSIERELMPERAARNGDEARDLLAAAAALADHFHLTAGPLNGGGSAASGTSSAGVPDPFAALGGWRHPGLGSGGAD